MVDKIDFFTPVVFERPAHNALEKAVQTVDGYFSFFEDRVAYVITDAQGPNKASNVVIRTSNITTNIFLTVVKAISYYTIVIPLIMLAIKALLRSQLRFRLITESDDSESGKEAARTGRVAEGIFPSGPQNNLSPTPTPDAPDRPTPAPGALAHPIPKRLKNEADSEESLMNLFDLFSSDLKKSLRAPITQRKIKDFLKEHAHTLTGTLNLANKELLSLPAEIRFFTNIDTLDLRDNHLTDLPLKAMTEMRLLHMVLLQGNPLPARETPSIFPSGIEPFFSELPPDFREKFEVGTDRAAYIRDNASSMSGNLDLSGRGFREIPEEIGLFSSVETLNLSNNCLTTLPATLGEMGALRYLNLQGNALTTFPDISRLDALMTLDVSHTNITIGPREEFSLPRNLRQILVSEDQVDLLYHLVGKRETITRRGGGAAAYDQPLAIMIL